MIPTTRREELEGKLAELREAVDVAEPSPELQVIRDAVATATESLRTQDEVALATALDIAEVAMEKYLDEEAE